MDRFENGINGLERKCEIEGTGVSTNSMNIAYPV
jgi:hypothetical protein